MSADYASLARTLTGEAALVVGALAVLGFDLVVGRKLDLAARWRAATCIGLAAATAALVLVVNTGPQVLVADYTFHVDMMGIATRVGALILAGFTLAIASETNRLKHPAEFVAVVLFATTGFLLMAIVQNLLLAFLAIELASLSLYILVGFDKSRPESAEAALKYFLFGGMSAAFLLFGFSLLYGLTGSLDFPDVAVALSHGGLTPPIALALVMVLVAFGFKAAAAPFHLWAPDAYQGAPSTAAALIASASKLAGLTLFAHLLWPAFAQAPGRLPSLVALPEWLSVVAALSLASLLVGNLGALAQSNLRRLLAYSAIAHAGALLLGVMTAGTNGPGALFYYAMTYGLATVGAFGVIAVLEHAGVGPRIEDLAGLHRRSRLLTGCLAIFVLSLAGIPPLAGFFGKFFVFAAALRIGGLSHVAGGLAFAAIFLSAVALYYYLIVLKQALVVAAKPENDSRIAVPFTTALALIAIAGLVIFLGLFPSLILGVAW